MTLKCHTSIRIAHPRTIVDHLYERAAGILKYDGNRVGSGINRVLYKLLYYRCRTLYHLSGCYLVSHRVGKLSYYVIHFFSSSSSGITGVSAGEGDAGCSSAGSDGSPSGTSAGVSCVGKDSDETSDGGTVS